MYDGPTAYIIAAITGYLVGSIPLAYWISQYAAKVDIRLVGEGNVGARNVFHAIGHRWGIVAFVGDFGKGAVLAAVYRNQSYWLIVTAGFALFVGHGWPIWLKFIGGKGLSTVGGFSAMLTPWATALGGVAALPVWFTTRRFIPTLVTTIIVTLSLSPFFDVPWQHLVIIAVLFICTGVKRLLDEPRMKRIEESNGWRRIGGVAKPQ
jgi:acyl-phosphate glycerol 3-phosphate acyltransferase